MGPHARLFQTSAYGGVAGFGVLCMLGSFPPEHKPYLIILLSTFIFTACFMTHSDLFFPLNMGHRLDMSYRKSERRIKS